MDLIHKLYDSSGKEWKGSFNELSKTCETYIGRAFKCKSQKWVVNEQGQEEIAYEIGDLYREIHYRSEYGRGMSLPYVLVTYVWQNGKQIFPKTDDQ